MDMSCTSKRDRAHRKTRVRSRIDMSRRHQRFGRTGRRKTPQKALAGMGLLLWCAASASAQTPQPSAAWLGSVALAAAAAEEPAPSTAPRPAGWSKPIPLSFSVDYTLVSDYIWRGVNFSEYAGEGREKPNHQMGVGVAYETEKLGTFSAGFWFEWFAGQKSLDPASDGHLQEVDYTLSWSYDIESIGVGVEVGWIAYQFPQSGGDAETSYEWYVGLAFDDSRLFGTDEGVLNPSVTYYQDVDLAPHGQWLEFGIGHDFALADLGCGQTPVLKDLTVSPSLVLGVDHRYFTPSTQLANLTYGLAFSYDLSSALAIPEPYGALSLTGFLNFSQALGLKEDLDGYQDEFYGGFTLAYEW